MMLRSLTLLLTALSVGAATQQSDFHSDVVSASASASDRQLSDEFMTGVTIPPAAHGAYCTAIMGWHDSCKQPPVSAGPDAGVCDGTTIVPLADPLFIDLKTCYSNPYLSGQSISFFGETPDKQKILEFHMIFKTPAAAVKYGGLNCQPNGACTCPPTILALKPTFLLLGSCDGDSDEYECIGEDFWGDTDECFVPATILNGPDSVTCALAASVQQFAPCDTVLDIPDPAYDAYCTGITGWYDTCGSAIATTDDDSACDGGNFNSLPDPLFIDLDTCYVNPNLGDRAVSFYGKGADGYVKDFHLIFNTATSAKYKPTNCQPNGACTCPPAILDLKSSYLQKGGCVSTAEFTCVWNDFFGDTSRCFIPASLDLGAEGFFCNMVARVEKFEPCDRSAISGTATGGTAAVIPATPPPVPATPPPVPVVVPATPLPVVPATPPPVAAVVPATPPPVIAVVPATALPIPTPAAPLPVTPADNTLPNQHDSPLRDENVIIPGPAHLAYCTAILGWYNTCTRPADDAPETASVCDGASYTPLATPAFVDLDHCYSNPSLGEKSISFFGETPDKKKIMEFHMIFPGGIQPPYGPLVCDANGVCQCSPTITALKQQFLSTGSCGNTDDYSCLSEDFYGENEECFVPATQLVDANGIVCSMVAKLQQYAPCDMVLDIPDKAVDAYCTAITGWYDTCVEEMPNPEDDVCDAGGFEALDDPLFIDFDHCYSNPELDSRSVSFFGKDKDDLVVEFHIITREPDSKYAPKDCDENGMCLFTKELKKLQKKFTKTGMCEPTKEYYCQSEEFYGDTDRCWVPATADFGSDGGGFHCAMLARVEEFQPCVKGKTFARTKGSGRPGVGDIVLRATVVLLIVAVIYCAFLKGAPILQKRRQRLAMKEQEDDDEVVMVRKGGNVYRDEPRFSDVPRAGAQISIGTFG